MLTLERVAAGYGRITALHGVSLTVGAAEFVCLIGANGAGKSTTLKTISGWCGAGAGRIVFDGQEIQRLAPQDILRRGIAHCPEGRRVFPHMTVEENLQMGAYVRTDADGGRGGPRAGLRPLPDPGRPAAPGRGHALGRRAADAGHRPLPDGAPPAHPVRRALARAGPHRDRDRVPDHRGHPAGGHHGADGRAERLHGAPARRPRLRHGDRPHHPRRPRERPDAKRPRQEGLPGRLHLRSEA